MKKLKVSSNSRYLTFENDQAFFYMGDTAWELFQRLTLDEAKKYLTDRAEKGFTVIQATVLSETSNLINPNVNGDLALIDEDLSKPNEKYFEHVDKIVSMANELGLVVGMLPTWGKYWKEGMPHCRINKTNAYDYGVYLGNRYENADLIWILGGDQNPKNEDEKETIRLLAKGLRFGDNKSHLITYHPIGPGSSSYVWHSEDLLDFNMFQSSHAARNHFNAAFTQMDYNLTPVKPTLDGEPRYEQITVGFYNEGTKRTVDKFDDFDARQAAYWSVFSGACGHTYGNNNIWQMWDFKHEPTIDANISWYQAIHHPGARQMGYMKNLMENIHFEKFVPANEILVNAVEFGGGKTLAVKSEDGDICAVYSPFGAEFTLDLTWSKGNYAISWFDPRYGYEQIFFKSDHNLSIQTFTPPTNGRGQDWVLVIKKI